MRLIQLFIVCLLLNACMFGTSKTAKFYTMTPTPAQLAYRTDYTGFVGINRIQLPKYMDRPQIVTEQKDSAQVHMSEYNRWAEAPSVLATRVLAEDLGVLLPAAQVKTSQSKGEEFDRTVFVEVSRLDAVLGEKAEMVAWYTIKSDPKKIIAREKFTATVQIGKTYNDLATGYSQLLAKLGEQIAGSLLKQ